MNDWYHGKVVEGLQTLGFHQNRTNKKFTDVLMRAIKGWCTADGICRCPQSTWEDNSSCCDYFKTFLSDQTKLETVRKNWCSMETWYMSGYDDNKLTGSQAVSCLEYYKRQHSMEDEEANDECDKPENVGRTFRIKTELPFITKEKPGGDVTCLVKRGGSRYCRCPTDCPTCGTDCCDYLKKDLYNPNDSCEMASWYKDKLNYGSNEPSYIPSNSGLNKLTEVEELSCERYMERMGKIHTLAICNREWLKGMKYYGPVDPLRPTIDIWCHKNVCKCSEEVLDQNGVSSCCSYLKENLLEKEYDTCDMTWFGENINEIGGVQYLAKQMKEVNCMEYFMGQTIKDYRNLGNKKIKKVLTNTCSSNNYLAFKRFYLPEEGAETVRASCSNNVCKCMTDEYAQWKEVNVAGSCCDFLKETLA